MVNYQPVPIIDVPGFGDLSAVTACENLKIKSQNDTGLVSQNFYATKLKSRFSATFRLYILFWNFHRKTSKKVKLQQAKEQVYLKGFYEGVIKVGKYAGTQIQKCKEEIKADMVKVFLKKLKKN